MKELFTIGELSKLFQVKISTLRYYDEIGLLKPEYIDKSNNYRYYSTQHFERLSTIKYLRALGVPISDLLDFFDYRDTDKLIEMLNRQQAEIANKKRELELIDRKIKRRLTQIHDAINHPLGTIMEVRLPKLRVAHLTHDYRPGEDIEYPIAELRKNFNIDESIFLGKIGISVALQDIEANTFDRYNSIFMILEEGDNIPKAEVIFPAREYLRVRFSGTHVHAAGFYEELLKYSAEHGYSIVDDSIEITLIDYGITNSVDKYVTEILLPFSRR
ncbi:GntR family transcriptional regulator [Bacillus sp. FJAT-27264]|uniref:MerR family transcriptional regulator n=1 Tax=Paenibacillus sp. (strain DSM 101736 / FJAT-27264) TaxID=1850362 RepID=UPI000807DB6A|nr:MerR family transcriptional regulator [Bacillus sp. FJAT-27264]OBZ16212.1 GntR family transcriptional regulator [Bacillus sp. FJAT-27264]